MYVSPPTQSSLKGVSLEVSAVRLRVRAREGALRVGVARDGGLNLEPLWTWRPDCGVQGPSRVLFSGSGHGSGLGFHELFESQVRRASSPASRRPTKRKPEGAPTARKPNASRSFPKAVVPLCCSWKPGVPQLYGRDNGPLPKSRTPLEERDGDTHQRLPVPR